MKHLLILALCLLTLPSCETLDDPSVQAKALEVGFAAINLAAELQRQKDLEEAAQKPPATGGI